MRPASTIQSAQQHQQQQQLPGVLPQQAEKYARVKQLFNAFQSIQKVLTQVSHMFDRACQRKHICMLSVITHLPVGRLCMTVAPWIAQSSFGLVSTPRTPVFATVVFELKEKCNAS